MVSELNPVLIPDRVASHDVTVLWGLSRCNGLVGPLWPEAFDIKPPWHGTAER